MMLKSLPSRASDTAEIDRQAFIIGQQGVTRGALAEAVKQVLRGALGHGFHPSAPEFSLLCDGIQRKQAEERARGSDERRQRRDNEQQRLRHEQTKTPEARARVAAMLARFNQSHDEAKASERQSGITETPDQVRDRLIGQIGETAFNNIPDLPVRDTFKQVGAAR